MPSTLLCDFGGVRMTLALSFAAIAASLRFSERGPAFRVLTLAGGRQVEGSPKGKKSRSSGGSLGNDIPSVLSLCTVAQPIRSAVAESTPRSS